MGQGGAVEGSLEEVAHGIRSLLLLNFAAVSKEIRPIFLGVCQWLAGNLLPLVDMETGGWPAVGPEPDGFTPTLLRVKNRFDLPLNSCTN